ncbi:hypothetical protein Tco_1521555, partial [Tanacetum coccineum]
LKEASRIYSSALQSFNLCHSFNQSFELQSWPFDQNVDTLGLPACHSLDCDVCASFVSKLAQKPTLICAFTIVDVALLEKRFHDHIEAIPVHRIHVIEGVQREQGHKIVGVESAVTPLTERITELERDNRRLRGTASVESQRVDQL